MPAIGDRQNDQKQLDIARANNVAHSRAQHLDLLRLGIATAIAIGGLASTRYPSIATPMSAAGTIWAVLYSTGLASWSSRERRRAAILQEMFDTQLFAMRWNSVLAGEALPIHEVSHLSKRFNSTSDLIRDYYEIPDIPPPYDVLACQQQNLAWGARVHRRYAYFSLLIASALAAVGPLLALANGLTVLDLITRWYVPSLGLLLLAVDNWQAHLSIATDRERTLSLMNSRIGEAVQDPHKAQELPLLARDVQDVLLLGRLKVPRVPDLFFLRFRPSDREDFRATVEDLRVRVSGNVRP
jgi:SMODS-associating 4TM effector domain